MLTRRRTAALAALIAAFCFALPAYSMTAEQISAALDSSDEPAEYEAQARAAESIVKADGRPGGAAALTQLARAYYLMGESALDKKARLRHFDRAISSAKAALKAGPDDPHALYWLSMAMLQKADIVGAIKALGLVKDALKGLKEVAAKDVMYDFAGAYRSRGKVLMEAPGWSFIGDRDEGFRLIAKACELSPECLVNRLYMAEAYAASGMNDEARAELSFILDAPLGAKRPKDDEKTKQDAVRMLDKLGRKD